MDDRAFLFQVYAATREEELTLLPWDDQQKETFLRMQFDAQDQYYQQQFPDATFNIIMQENCPVGRLYVDRRTDEIRIIDIALLPAFRNAGLGSALLMSLIDEGAKRGLAVRIHVEHANPALRLYERLGFNRIGDTGIYYLMELVPLP